MKDIPNYLTSSFENEPLFVNPSQARWFPKQFFFIPITSYPPKWQKKLVAGEIGIHDFRRIVIRLPMPKKPKLVFGSKLLSDRRIAKPKWIGKFTLISGEDRRPVR